MKSIALSLFLLVALSIPARAGNEAGGGGISENNILFAFTNLDKFIELCRAMPSCGLEVEDYTLLGKISASLPQERSTKEPIQFRSGYASPGFFVVDGLVRLAKTGYHVGDPIYVNTDFLYPQATATTVGIPAYGRPFDIPQAVSMLVHELGHHQGVTDHTRLDQLGSKVQTIMRSNTQEVDGGPDERDLIATAIDYSGVAASDLLIRDHLQLLSLTEELKQNLHCAPGDGAVSGFWLWNLHWGRYSYRPDTGHRRPLHARVRLLCGEPPRQKQIPIEMEIELFAKPSQAGPLEWQKGPHKFTLRH